MPVRRTEPDKPTAAAAYSEGVSAAELYRNPIRLLREKIGHSRSKSDEGWLLHEVLRACESARRYTANAPDEHEALRRKDASAVASLKDQFKAIDTLASFAREYGQQSGLALMSAGFRGRDKDAGKGLSIAFVDMLMDYRCGLEITTRKAGPWTHRFVRANLIFQEPIDNRRNPFLVGTGLLFQIVFLFRNYTAGVKAFARYGAGDGLPKLGASHYDIAADFVAIATGEKINDPKARLLKFMRENPGVGLWPWPPS
jgi:hypothetical protein